VLDAGHEVIDKFAPSGQYIGQITGPFTYSPLGLGVDPSGNVRVDVKGPDPEGGTLAVEVFDDATVNGFTTLISKQLHGGQVIGTQEYYGFATAGQPGGDYPLLSCKCAARLGPNGEQYGRVDDGTTAVAVAVAVDPAGGHVYVDDQSALEHSVSEWDTGEMNGTPVVAHNEKETKSTGTFVASVGSLELMGSTEHPEQGGIAVDGATGDVYVSNPADGRVYVFGSNAPTAVVEAPANVTRTRATLHGTVNPRGVLMECRFEYNTGGSYDLTLPLAVLEHSVPCLNANGESVVDSTSPVAVHADIGVPPQAPLQPGSLYHFRLVVASANGESHGGGLFPTASAGFGFKQFEVSFLNRDGTPDVQAASHPYKMVTTVAFNTQVVPTSPTELLYSALPAGNAKDITLHLPPGFYGDPNATAKKCTLQQLAPGGLHDICPAESELGTLEAEDVAGPEPFGPTIDGKKLVNVEPPPGVAFQMAAKILAPDAFIDAGVPAGGDSGVTAVLEGIPVTVPVFRGITTIFGVPPLNPRGPLLTMPTSCNGPLTSTISGDSYQDAGHFVSAPPSVAPGMSGCAQLEFHPTLETKPDSPNASSASGLDVHVRVPQKAALNPTGLAESTLRDTTVALPPGVAINPSGGGGLEGCSEGLAGVTGSAEFNHGSEPGDKTITFTPTSLEQLEPGVSFCPDASKVGTVKVKTPLLENPLEGAVYVASQNQNPFGSLIAMYLMFEDPISGSTFKIPFKVQLCQSQGEVIGGLTCQAPGQIITTAHNTPELPFEDLELHFFGGERAPLTTPSRCGAYTTEALLTPWDGNGPVTSTSSFNIEQGPHGGPCPGTHLPFNAAFTGGSTNLQAGAFTSFTLSAIRHDGEQNVQSLRATLPPGLSGRISNIELCPEPQANEGTCPPGSLIGETTVTVGVGSHPFTVTGGKLYLTVPYNGTGGCTMHPPGGASSEPGCAPFGLTFEVPAKAGPFDLEKTAKHHPACDCVVVRGKVEIDPITSALTITTDPPGTEHAIPTMLEGIPLEVQQVNGTTTRPNFQFNPTSCAKMGLTGRLFSTEGAQDTIELPYQVTNCAALKFEPKLSVSTSGRTSKAGGASLTAKVTYPNVPQGTDADIAKVKVELPKQLPSRLTTLQKACTDKQFAANPAGCPPESKIGYAVVHTPVLPVPLQGPAIFVSHGGEAFPSLTMVLQGDNVTIDLVGTTFISKAGITSTDFKTVPDQPFSSFELTLPEGKYSALTANGNLCSSTRTVLVKRRVTVRVHGRRRTVTRKVRQTQAAPLQMPTEFVGQNGAVIRKTTKIAVTGCPKKVKKKARKASSSHRHGKGAATRG
jgi:DNA-binding beta-propeller fold protein YncE